MTFAGTTAVNRVPFPIAGDVWLPARAGPRSETTEGPTGTLIARQHTTQNAPRALLTVLDSSKA